MAICLVLSLVPTHSAFAINNKLFFVDVPTQVDEESQFTIRIRAYANNYLQDGTAKGAVTYSPSNLLKVVKTSKSNSGYNSVSVSEGSGRVNFDAEHPNQGFSHEVFSLTFKAVKGGRVTIGFTGNGASRVNNALTDLDAVSVQIKGKAKPPSNPTPSAPTNIPLPPPTSSSSTPKPASPSETTAPQSTPDPTGLIDSVAVEPLYESSTVTWNVNASKASATLRYGVNSTTMNQQAKVTKKKDGSFSADIEGLVPGMRYYFTISGKGAGGKAGTYSGTIFTNGYPVTITVTENNIPVKNAVIQIGSITRSTNAEGKLSIGLAADNYNGTITTDTATMSFELTVEKKPIPANGSAPASQRYNYNLTSSVLENGPGSGPSILAFIGVLLGGTAVLGIGFIAFMAYRRRRFENEFSPQSNNPTVIIDDGYDWQRHGPHR